MRVGELAGRTGLTAKTIRFYKQAGVLPEPERRPSGYRDYDESALARLQFVRAAQAAGLTLAEIRRVIDLREQAGPPCRHVAELLDAHAVDLTRRIAELTALREEVQYLRQRAEHLDPASCVEAAVCHVIPPPATPGTAAASPRTSARRRSGGHLGRCDVCTSVLRHRPRWPRCRGARSGQGRRASAPGSCRTRDAGVARSHRVDRAPRPSVKEPT